MKGAPKSVNPLLAASLGLQEKKIHPSSVQMSLFFLLKGLKQAQRENKQLLKEQEKPDGSYIMKENDLCGKVNNREEAIEYD